MRRYIIDNAADVAARLPRRRPAPRRRARPHDDRPPSTCSRNSPSEVDALSAHVGRPLTLIAESDLNDPRLITAARGRRLRPRRAVERRLPPRPARRAHRRDHRLLRRLRAARGARPRCVERGFFHDGTFSSLPRSRTTARRSTRDRCRPGASWSATRTTTRSATARSATG